MDIPHRKISVDINRLTPLSVKLIGNIGDKNTRYLELQLTANNKPIEFEEGCTATVTYAVEKVENAHSGIMKIQPKIIDAENNVLILQTPIYVHITYGIAGQGRS